MVYAGLLLTGIKRRFSIIEGRVSGLLPMEKAFRYKKREPGSLFIMTILHYCRDLHFFAVFLLFCIPGTFGVHFQNLFLCKKLVPLQ